MTATEQLGLIRSTCERTLQQNWREAQRTRDGVAFAYTCPSPGHYPWQWYFWNTPLRGVRRFTYNVVGADASMTSSIQPPALAWAWLIAVGDPREVPAITRHHDWLKANRDLDGDGLIWIVQPDESGLDASPQFDAIWGRRAHSRLGYLPLVRRNRHLHYELRRIADAGGPVCCEVLTNVLYSLSRSALGLPSLTATLVERMYDEEAGLFVEEHLLDRQRFWLPVPPASVPADDPTFSLNDADWLGTRRYWRGPTWVNAAWLLWLGLVRLGYGDQASALAAAVGGAVARAGLREYYNPYTGEGMGAVDFAWSSLVLELIDPDPRAVGSYLA